MAFSEKWDGKYPTVYQLWTRHWAGIIPFLAFPSEIRKVIYTTNAIESINSQIRKIIRSKGSFPNDEAAIKLIYLALRNAQKNGLCLSMSGNKLLTNLLLCMTIIFSNLHARRWS